MRNKSQQRRNGNGNGANPFDNPAFRRELGIMLDDKLKPFGKLQAQVQEHDRVIQRAKGAIPIVSALWALIIVVVEWALHRGGK